MDVRQLRSFVAVVESGSFSRAALELGMTQQALSQQIANLEEGLGVSLLLRGARGVTPLETGLKLFEHAKAILRHIEAAVAEVRHLDVNPVGDVALGMPVTTTEMLSVPLLREAEARHPTIVLRIVEGLGRDSLRLVRDGRLDLAIVAETPELEGLAAEPLVIEELYLVGAPSALKQPAPVPIKSLADVPLILPARPHNLRETIERHAAAAGFRLRIKTEIEGLPLIKALVKAGYAQSILTWTAMHEEWARGDLAAAVLDPAVERKLLVVSRADRPMTRAASEVLSLLRRMVERLVREETWRATLPPQE
jgi:LysR family transcriptional regulator, nitrogen assimilation regulatory protein